MAHSDQITSFLWLAARMALYRYNCNLTQACKQCIHVMLDTTYASTHNTEASLLPTMLCGNIKLHHICACNCLHIIQMPAAFAASNVYTNILPVSTVYRKRKVAGTCRFLTLAAAPCSGSSKLIKEQRMWLTSHQIGCMSCLLQMTPRYNFMSCMIAVQRI